MPGEPLIFVEVALVKGLAGSVQGLLDEKAPVLDPREADTAIFYSISNCQRGLAGISFGNFLIKRVVEELSARVPQPEDVRDAVADPRLPPLAGREAGGGPTGPAVGRGGGQPAARRCRRRPANRRWRAFWRSAAGGARSACARPRSRCWCGCARAICWSRSNGGKRARDPVAHFHLSNGARVERFNMLGDTSEKGAKESATLMVNYLYDPAKIEDWHEDYAGEGKRNASTTVRRLARGWS